jgi:hypothetical protein
MMAGLEVEGEPVCGACSGLTTRAGRDIRAAFDAKRPIIVDIDRQGRHPIVRA